MASQKTNYFYIGFFVLLGIALIILALVFWGAKNSTKDVIYVETYFDESVQGLSVGSPVKYRGMQIGHVVDIATVNSIYQVKQATNYNEGKSSFLGGAIYVKMAIGTRYLNLPKENFHQIINTAVTNGLRTKLSIQGLTGSAFINLDFEDPKKNHLMQIAWTPEYAYIPSTPSTLAFFGENAEYLLGELRKIDLPKTFKYIQDLIISTNQTVENTNKILATSNKQVMEMLTNIGNVSQNIKQISEKAKEQPSTLLFGNPPPALDLNKL